MKTIIQFAGAMAVALAATQSMQATPFTGSIGFGGDVTFDTGSAANATEVVAWENTQVISDSGVFATYITPVAPATFTSLIWDFLTPAAPTPAAPPGASAPIANFWMAGGFTFELLSSFVVTQGGAPGSGYVVISGTGLVSGNGYGPTPLSWSFTSQDPMSSTQPPEWTFSASSNSVPDGGATVMLLGIALSATALLRKKLKA